MPELNKLQEETIIKKANIPGKIEKTISFTNSESNYLLIINQVIRYAIRLVSYQENSNGELEIIAIKRFPESLFGFYLSKKEAEEVAQQIIKSYRGFSLQVKNYESHSQQLTGELTNETLINLTEQLFTLKKVFLTNRETTITKLRECCDILEAANIGKYAKREEVSKTISAIGKLVGKWTLANIAEPIGDSFSVANARQKRKFAIENSNLFQEFLTEEESQLATFSEIYYSLILALQQGQELEIASIITEVLRLESEEVKLFNTHYKLYEVATNIWANKAHLDASDMKEAISDLQSNLLDLKEELKAQQKSFQKKTISQNQATILDKEQVITDLTKQMSQQLTLLQNNSQSVANLNQLLTKLQKEETAVKELQNSNNKLTEQLGEIKDEEIIELKQEVQEFKKDNSQLISQLLANEREELDQLTSKVKNGQLELVDKLLEKQVKVKDLERYAQTETLEQPTTNQPGQQVILEEFKENKQLQVELQTRMEQPSFHKD